MIRKQYCGMDWLSHKEITTMFVLWYSVWSIKQLQLSLWTREVTVSYTMRADTSASTNASAFRMSLRLDRPKVLNNYKYSNDLCNRCLHLMYLLRSTYLPHTESIMHNTNRLLYRKVISHMV